MIDKQWFNFITDAFYAQGVEKEAHINNANLLNYFACRFKKSVFDEYLRCTGYRTWDYLEYLFRFLEIFSGKWYQKIRDEPHGHYEISQISNKQTLFLNP